MQEILLASMGELALKGLNRRTFENTLLKTIRKRLESLGEWSVTSAQSAIYMEPKTPEAQQNTDTAFARVEKIFGIAALSRAAVCEKDLDCIQKTAAEYLKPQLEAATTFKVRGKRADKTFPLNSLEMGAEVGGYLLDKYPNLKVDVHHPQLEVMVEIRETAAYVHGGKQKGAGGLPIPSSGRAALLLSGGIDSPVAGWMMAKRGLSLVGVHFASPPYTSPRAAAKVESLANILSTWVGPMPYYHVPYTKAQEYLRDQNPKPDYFTVLMRRSMLRITRMIAEKENCEAMVTGESLAQVASQTLQAIACTDSAQDLPILRPCIGMDKNEITLLARQIGSYETSILPYEDCCTIFTPPHPKTKPRMRDIEVCEKALAELPALEAQAAQEASFQLVYNED